MPRTQTGQLDTSTANLASMLDMWVAVRGISGFDREDEAAWHQEGPKKVSGQAIPDTMGEGTNCADLRNSTRFK